ncbi:LysR family transcriptional regulator [Streptomyces sp. ISL-10]|uniref:LysR family transcriptional regulator n=1 Tax=Streptomyces sp. ISL-10 TaxID=2819172 RepID=UPI001BE603CD|nr:LysR family transcriptional regulator [Streptomyces sp. ISL-10]MBT2365913.1 LysR family transcriptional regulator [Streptomyces sp. ISL-10]
MYENDALRRLVALAETGAFTKAAVRLSSTQPAVSRRITSSRNWSDLSARS